MQEATTELAGANLVEEAGEYLVEKALGRSGKAKEELIDIWAIANHLLYLEGITPEEADQLAIMKVSTRFS